MASVKPLRANNKGAERVSDPKTPGTTLSVGIEGMSCASCVGRVEKALKAIESVESANVNLATERAKLNVADTPDWTAIQLAVEKAGYEVATESTDLAVEGMSCASCVGRIEKALVEVPGVLEAQVNLATEKAQVRHVAGPVDAAALEAAVRAAGYEARRLSDSGSGDRQVQRRADEITSLKRNIVVAAAATLPIFVLEMGSHFIAPMHMWLTATVGQQNLFYLFFVLASLVQFGPGLRFYRKGWPALLRGGPDMNSLVMIGTSAAYGYS